MTQVDNTKQGVEDLTGEDILYDDFFTDEDDPGIAVVIEHKGKLLPFRVKKSLTLSEKQLAADAGVSIELDKAGNPSIKKMDQSAYTREIVLSGVKEWPFKYGEHPKIAANLRGKTVPITRHHVSRMDGVLAEKVAGVILGQQEVQRAAVDPFEQKSDEDS